MDALPKLPACNVMTGLRLSALGVLLALAPANIVGAQVASEPGAPSPAAPEACPSTPVALPAELANWAPRLPLPAARDAKSTSNAQLTLGKAVDAELRATPEVRYSLRPEKPGGSASFGGLYVFTVAQGGSFRVALGSAAWIDVLKASSQGSQAMRSVAHGHGPDCSGIRKMVDFTLEPGSYVLQVSANSANRLPLLVTRLP